MTRKVLIILVLAVVLAVGFSIVSVQANGNGIINTVVRDVEVYDLVVDPNTVEPGDSVKVEVYVRNNGEITESFDVTCYYGSVEIDTVDVITLSKLEARVITFDLDTAGMPLDEHLITVWADSAEELFEVDEVNNWCTAPASLFVVPEIPLLGTVGASLAMFAGLAIYMKRNRKN